MLRLHLAKKTPINMYVYIAVHKVTGKAYVGQTTGTVSRRWRQHCFHSNGNCRLLHRALLKYGPEMFSVRTLGTYDSLPDLNAAEEYFIEHYQALHPGGYNLKPGGDNKKHHQDTKRLIAVANSGSRNWQFGKPRPQSTREKMKAAWVRRKLRGASHA